MRKPVSVMFSWKNTLPKETTTDDDDDDDDNDDDELFCSDLLNGDWDFISSQQQ